MLQGSYPGEIAPQPDAPFTTLRPHRQANLLTCWRHTFRLLYLTEKLLVGRVNDVVSRERVLPLEPLPAGRTNEGGFAGVLRKMLQPSLEHLRGKNMMNPHWRLGNGT